MSLPYDLRSRKRDRQVSLVPGVSRRRLNNLPSAMDRFRQNVPSRESVAAGARTAASALAPYGDVAAKGAAAALGAMAARGIYNRMTKSSKPSKKRKRRAIPRIRGNGDYWTDGTARDILSTISAGLGAGAGGLLGAPGGPVGVALGGAGGLSTGYGAGNVIADIVGMGDYTVRSNSLLNMGQQTPSFGNLSNATIITHREYIMDISGSGAETFNNIQFPLNPGLASTFPYLSGIACNYQEYQFLGCILEFRSTSSDAATTLPLGSIIMASNYDTADPKYRRKLDMENSQYAVSTKPSNSMIHPIECDPSVTFVPIKYVRQGAVPSGKDSRLYDHCNVNVATVGLPAGTTGNIGELWISYQVAFFKPYLGTTQSVADHFNLGTNWASGGGWLGTTAALAIATVAETGSNLGCLFASKSVITFPRTAPIGTYMLHVRWQGASTALTTGVAITLGTGLTAVNMIANDLAATCGAGAGETAVQQWVQYIFAVNTPLTDDTTISFTAGTLPGTPNNGDLFICNLAQNLTG